MNKICALLAILLVFFATSSSFAANPIKTNSINNEINQILKNFGENINIGIMVQDAKTGKILYQKNADRYFMPASNEKLFTAFAALQYLNPNFAYHTQLFVDTSKIQNGVLNDNVYLQFTGDPMLTYTQLDHLISSLSQAGISRINGNVIVDDTAFDQIPMSPGTTWDDKDFCWGSPINAIILDHNCVSATLTPAAQSGQPANLALPDHPQSMRFINQVITHESTETECTLGVTLSSESTYTLTGCIKTSDTPKNVKMAVNNPRYNIRTILAHLLDKYKIAASRHIKFEKVNAASKLLAYETSPPLQTLISNMLKESDNTIADALFKTIGAQYTHESGSFKNGSLALHDILLKSIPLDIPKTTLIDGAGGSRYDYLTPRQMTTLLQKAYYSPYASLFISALPIAGIDGTLKDRMKDPVTLGKVFAKTGTMSATTSLAGYLVTQNQKTLIFSIMINGFVDLPSKYKALEDQICTALIKDE